MLVVDGNFYEVRGVESADFRDPRFRLHSDDFGKRKSKWVRAICMHTRMGLVAPRVEEHGRDRRWDEVVAGRWGRDGRMAGAHISIDADGSFVCHADLLTERTYHAGQVNDFTVGIEMYQDADGTLYRPTIDTAVRLADAITWHLGIQRQVVTDEGIQRELAAGGPRPWLKRKRLPWMGDGRAGARVVGVYGHRNVTRNRGPGDPGDQIIEALAREGYEPISLQSDEWRERWRNRQAYYGIQADGIPGPATRRTLAESGYYGGQWVHRWSDQYRTEESIHVR